MSGKFGKVWKKFELTEFRLAVDGVFLASSWRMFQVFSVNVSSRGCFFDSSRESRSDSSKMSTWIWSNPTDWNSSLQRCSSVPRFLISSSLKFFSQVLPSYSSKFLFQALPSSCSPFMRSSKVVKSVYNHCQWLAAVRLQSRMASVTVSAPGRLEVR